MMKLFLIFCFYLTWLTLFKMTAASNDQSHKILKFGETTGDYVKFKPDMQPLTDGLSICSWIRRLRSRNPQIWLSYNLGEILLDDAGNYNFMLRYYHPALKVQMMMTGSWYHYCICWDLTSRTSTIYHNGRHSASVSTPGRRLSADGYLVLGQEQRSYGAGFRSLNVFGGELSKLNIFSKKLNSSEVSEMYSAGRCSDIEKKHDDTRHLKWEDILQQSRTGNVSVIVTCEVQKQLDQLEEELAEARKELEATKSELNNTKASKKEISQQLNCTVTDLKDKSAELDKVRAELQETSSQLTETETKLNSTEKNLDQIGTRLEATQSELNNTKEDLGHKSAKLNKVRAELQETTNKLTESEIKLNITEKNLARCQANRETVEDLKDMLNTSIGKITTEMETHSEEVAKLEEQIAGMSKGAKILAAEGGLRDEKCAEVCAGTTGRKSTTWENFGAQGIHTTVDISGCGFVTIPTVTTSLEGDWRHWKNSGGSEIYKVTTSSFQTYIHVPEKDLRHRAADLQWNMEWIAVGYTC